MPRSHKATLLSPKQDKVVLTAKAAWATACLCSGCCSRTCVEKGKIVPRSKGNAVLCDSAGFRAHDSHAAEQKHLRMRLA